MKVIELAYLEEKTNKLANSTEITADAIQTSLKETYSNVTVDDELTVTIEGNRTYKINSNGSVTKLAGHVHTDDCYCIECEGDGIVSRYCEGAVQCGYNSNTNDFWHNCMSCGDIYYCYMQDYCVGIPNCMNEVEEECMGCIGGLLCDYY